MAASKDQPLGYPEMADDRDDHGPEPEAALTTADVTAVVPDDSMELEPLTTNDIKPIPEEQWGGAETAAPHKAAATKKAAS